MAYQIIDVPQRSAEWFSARLGRLTASDAGKMLATIKERWPSLFNSLLILAEGPLPGCPSCGSPTHRACVACDFVAA